METLPQETIEMPSKSTLAKATGIAFVVALILLFTVVLPAEYGFDPLRTGAALGLTGISQAQVKVRQADAAWVVGDRVPAHPFVVGQRAAQGVQAEHRV